jgi:hypothetical protein
MVAVVFSCGVCGRRFPSLEKLLNHRWWLHPKEPQPGETLATWVYTPVDGAERKAAGLL